LTQEQALALASPLVVEAVQAVCEVNIPLLAAATQSTSQFLAQGAA
jgi:hypothetical protein